MAVVATEIAKLNEDLISQILVRLPCISLLRCEGVSKPWLQLIQSPDFIANHLQHSKNREDRILIAHKYDDRAYFLSVHGNKSLEFISSLKLDIRGIEDFYIGITGPCNGLFCVLEYVKNEIVLYNPGIVRYKCVPPPLFRLPDGCKKGWSEYVAGFGFGLVSNPTDYKVVLFFSFMKIESDEDDDEDEDEDTIEADSPIKAEVYNLSTDCWREIECNCPDSIDHKDGIFFNGALHWTAKRKGVDIIASFDIGTEILQDLDVPKDLQGKHKLRKTLMVLNDCLAMFAYTAYLENPEEQFFDVWIMKESWSKQVSVGPLSGIYRPLMLWKNEAILLESIQGQMLSCSIETNDIQELDLRGEKGSMIAIVFKESLVSF